MPKPRCKPIPDCPGFNPFGPSRFHNVEVHGLVAISPMAGRDYLTDDEQVVEKPDRPSYVLVECSGSRPDGRYLITDGDDFFHCDTDDEDTADDPDAPTIDFGLRMKFWTIEPDKFNPIPGLFCLSAADKDLIRTAIVQHGL